MPVKAVVVPAAGTSPAQEDLIAFARDLLAGYKLPKSADFAAELTAQPKRQTAQTTATRAVLGGR